jgi:hypothetical protein
MLRIVTLYMCICIYIYISSEFQKIFCGSRILFRFLLLVNATVGSCVRSKVWAVQVVWILEYLNAGELSSPVGLVLL